MSLARSAGRHEVLEESDLRVPLFLYVLLLARAFPQAGHKRAVSRGRQLLEQHRAPVVVQDRAAAELELLNDLLPVI